MAPIRMSLQTLTILAALLEDPSREWYGLELMQLAGLRSGTTYSTLARMHEAGWLDAHWEEQAASELGRPRRRFYRLTPTGAYEGRAAYEAHMARLAKRPSGHRLRYGGAPA